MKLLPVPSLTETLNRYRLWVKPHLSDADFQKTSAIIHHFEQQEGPQLQQHLQNFAAEKKESSWLIDDWRKSYLQGRTPAALGANVSLELIFKDLEKIDGTLNQAAHFIAAQAKVHADYFSGAYHESYSPRGDKLCFEQLSILKGASRIPQKDIDRYFINDDLSTSRHIAIIWKNHTYLMPVLDEAGTIYSPNAIKKALKQIDQQTTDAPQPYFHSLSYAENNEASEILEQLCIHSENQHAFDAINRALFAITFIEADLSYIESAFEATFGEHFWAYKPLSYLYNLQTGQIQHHVEHTYEDAGTLVEIHQKATANLQAGLQGTDGVIPIDKIDWVHSDATQQALLETSASYQKKAAEYKQTSLDIPLKPASNYIRFSKDAAIQFALQYAMQKTFNQINNVYEAVDMREFQSGRTECVRPVSSQSVHFVHLLLQEDHPKSEQAQLKEFFLTAEAEHRERIKACKQGHGVNRHLMGLSNMAQKLNIQSALFDDIGYQKITTDFLSTTTLGDNGVVRDVGFIPAMDEGYAIYYQSYRDGIRFLLTYKKAHSEKTQQFIAALTEGIQRIFALVEQ